MMLGDVAVSACLAVASGRASTKSTSESEDDRFSDVPLQHRNLAQYVCMGFGGRFCYQLPWWMCTCVNEVGEHLPCARLHRRGLLAIQGICPLCLSGTF
mmetsp:Transcript_15825/g.40693  ORF Transcript_15825/g.40693 Transcript_15825/m.40693 type:complete len:99 (+) Transcript_15825:436-732(+)